MALRADDVQPAQIRDALPEFDVRAASRHVRGDGDATALAGPRHDLSLLLMKFRVKDGMDDAGLLEHPRKKFADLDRNGADQNWPSLLVDGLDFLQRGLVLFALGLVNRIVFVLAR